MQNSLERRFSSRYYHSINDLPVFNWWKIHEENDFKYLLKNPNKKVNKYAEKVFKSIKSEFINEFGIDRKYEQYIDKVIELTLLNIKIVKGKDKSKKIFADMLELEIKDLLTQEEKIVSKDKGFSAVSKYLGTSIKIKEITIYEFYSHIEAIKRHINNS